MIYNFHVIGVVSKYLESGWELRKFSYGIEIKTWLRRREGGGGVISLLSRGRGQERSIFSMCFLLSSLLSMFFMIGWFVSLHFLVEFKIVRLIFTLPSEWKQQYPNKSLYNGAHDDGGRARS